MIKVNCVFKGQGELPKYETIGAAGMDLRANQHSMPFDLKTTLDIPEEGVTLPPFSRILIKTGLFIELPEDIEAQIRPRSGLALKHGITIVNTPGTIDEDYRGEIGVILINTTHDNFTIHKGDRIAQMVFNRVEKAELINVNALNETTRGAGGFNSTGTK